MISYTIKKTDCLSSLMNSVALSGCRFWMGGRIPVQSVNSIIPRLISKYNLQQSKTDRQNLARTGMPIWNLVIHYNPSHVGELEFWLMTTGFRVATRSEVKDREQIDKLNSQLMVQENLKPIVTLNPLEYLTFGEYVLGLYVSYDELKESIENDYLFPFNYGIPIDPVLYKNHEHLSFKSINGLKTHIDLGSKLNHTDERRFNAIKENFGFLYMKDSETLELNQAKALSVLKKKYGVTVDEGTSYNDVVKLLSKHLNRTNNQYLHIFKRKTSKKIRFTWYLNNEFLKQTGADIENKIKMIPSRPQQFEDAVRRLYARGNFHGVRYQIGKISGRVKRIVKENYPIIYNKIDFPDNLHYVRYSPVAYKTFKEFQQACINETIMIERNKILRDENKVRIRKLRTALRHKKPELMEASPVTLNKLIREHDKTKLNYGVMPTDKEIETFINEHRNMDPSLISDTY